ncbi:MAG: protein-L-isoaspartate(D-aspartate) O-methyltransferase [Candidatus Desulfofervidus auxilii]|nr:protein-L-isoaspartate(D-aspartate) O-methyltransferase [Candidatus Desulfofervidus auxilii]
MLYWRIFLLFILIFLSSFCSAQNNDFAKLRKEMVEKQIKARGIKNKRILKVMEKVERHKFLPPFLQKFAYEDRPLPIGHGQTISQPYIVALMTELLCPKPTDKILEIGTGSGYQAAILAELVDKVYTIEIIPELAKLAEKRLKILGYKNVFVRCGDGYFGWPEAAPFDGIIVTCSPEKIPQPLIEQLKEGGRMVIPVGEGWAQKLLVLHKKKGKIIKQYITDVLFVPMKH